jgi:hypothetical protein|tara:strand:- start:280 stop:537 length:258 start_codon:yes stop_codon:yes gene_type:complete
MSKQETTEKEYLKAKIIVDTYEKDKYEKLLNSKRGDYLTYIGGSESPNLIIGEKYRLTCQAWNRRVAVINEVGRRSIYRDNFFKA